MQHFDVSRARLNLKEKFPRFRVGSSQPLSTLLKHHALREEDQVLVISRGGAHLAFTMRQMAYHHVAQGELAGHPYVVTF